MTTEINGYGLDLIEQVKKELHSIHPDCNILDKNFKNVIDVFDYFSQDNYLNFIIGKDVLYLYPFSPNNRISFIRDEIFKLPCSELIKYYEKGYTLEKIEYEFIKDMGKYQYHGYSYIHCISVNQEDYFIYDPDEYEE